MSDASNAGAGPLEGRKLSAGDVVEEALNAYWPPPDQAYFALAEARQSAAEKAVECLRGEGADGIPMGLGDLRQVEAVMHTFKRKVPGGALFCELVDDRVLGEPAAQPARSRSKSASQAFQHMSHWTSHMLTHLHTQKDRPLPSPRDENPFPDAAAIPSPRPYPPAYSGPSPRLIPSPFVAPQSAAQPAQSAQTAQQPQPRPAAASMASAVLSETSAPASGGQWPEAQAGPPTAGARAQGASQAGRPQGTGPPNTLARAPAAYPCAVRDTKRKRLDIPRAVAHLIFHVCGAPAVDAVAPGSSSGQPQAFAQIMRMGQRGDGAGAAGQPLVATFAAPQPRPAPARASTSAPAAASAAAGGAGWRGGQGGHAGHGGGVLGAPATVVPKIEESPPESAEAALPQVRSDPLKRESPNPLGAAK